mmetsp:Transcript_49457/g.143423  ORF Transcript_49457/g.143423 Transcript_49457/m.143423 type:complete len:392 (-) Transcript_49457:127-1302(-)
MGCGASVTSREKSGPTAPPVAPATPALLVPGQCAIALFAEVQPEHVPKRTVQSVEGRDVCWQAGSISLDVWRDFSTPSASSLEKALSEWTAGEAVDKTVDVQEDSQSMHLPFLPDFLSSSRLELSIDLETMMQTVLSGEEPLESNDPEAIAAASRESGTKVTLPVRRLEKNGDESWVVTHPDPSMPHPLRLQRIATRDNDETLSNDFFWRVFQLAMGQSGHPVEETSADQLFDFAHNHDYRGWSGGSTTARRGGVEYRIPVGWKRFAVRVAGRYDGGDNTWLCVDGRSGEWAVVYHGTKQAFLPHIVFTGLKAGSGQVYKREVGEGIYVTPNIDGVADGYSRTYSLDGISVRIVLQCRARPAAIKKCSRKDYWVVNDPSDLRPYGVLLKLQ